MKDTFGIDDTVMPIHFSSSLIRWLESQGYNPTDLLNHTGLNSADMDSPEILISFRQYRTLVLNALEITGNPHLGLMFGNQIKITIMGLAGYAAMTSDNLRQAIDAVINYMALRSTLMKISAHESDSHMHLRINEALDFGPTRTYICEGMYSAFGCLLDFSDLKLDSNIVATLITDEPDDWDQHKHLLPFEILFNQPFCEIIIPKEYLLLPSKFADPIESKAAKRICDKQLEAIDSREGIVTRIGAALSNISIPPKLDKMAELLSISPRTLRRELKKLDTSYQSILDEHRKQQAIHYLEASTLSLQEIATKMGYSDTTNFGRAFRKWTGNAPGSFRK